MISVYIHKPMHDLHQFDIRIFPINIDSDTEAYVDITELEKCKTDEERKILITSRIYEAIGEKVGELSTLTLSDIKLHYYGFDSPKDIVDDMYIKIKQEHANADKKV